MRPFDSVILTEDLPQHNIPAGTEGTIVDVFSQDDGVYAVELFDRDGNTLDVVDVRSDQMTVTLTDFFAGEQVALLSDLPKHHLVRGQVGVVQERVGVGLYMVEFADTTGAPHTRLTLHAHQMLLLQWHPTQQSA